MRRKVLLAMTLISLFLLVAGCGGKEETKTEEKSVPVEVAVATKMDLNKEMEMTGEVEAGLDVSLVPKVSGKVAAVYVKAGQSVNQGTTLIELEGTQVKNSLLSAQSTLAMQQANLDAAQKSYNRMKQLYDQGAVSLVQLEQAETQFKVCQAQYNQAQAALQIAQDNYQEITVTSPIAGKVSSIDVEVGELVGPQVPVAGVVNLGTVLVKLNLSENMVSSIAEGQKVDVTVTSINETVTGTIKSIAPKVDSRTKAYPVEVEMPNEDGKILAGMVAKLKLSTGRTDNAIVVPVDAVIEHNGRHKLYVVEKGVAKEREVTVGVKSTEQIQIISGLKEKEQVIVSGNRLVGDGQKVNVVKDKPGVK